MNIVGQSDTSTYSKTVQSSVDAFASSPFKRIGRKALHTASVALMLVSMSTSVWAACQLDEFKGKIKSTGTGPFNSADACVSNVNGVGGGTDHIAGNDACATDNVVRTNDTYIYRFDYRVQAGGKAENVVFRSTLPLVGGRKVAVWDGVPPQCSGTSITSEITDGGRTLTCDIGTVDRTGTGAEASALLAQVKTTVYGANNDPISGVTTSVTTTGATACTTADNPPVTPPTVSISAKQKTDFRKDVAPGQSAITVGGVPGYLVQYYIYMDQFDPSGASSKGGQSLNSPITLKDALGTRNAGDNPWPAGSTWYDCYKADGGQATMTCPANGTPVSGSVTLDITLTAQAGEEGEFMVAGGKNTEVQRNPGTGSPERLSTFIARIFVPVAAINAAGGQLNLNNAIPAEQIVGTDLSGAPIVDVRPENNNLSQTVVGTLPGSFYKYVAREWGGSWAGATPGGTNNGTVQMQGTSNWGDSGTGLTYPNQYFYPRLDYFNPDVAIAQNVRLCESFNAAEVRIAEISTIPNQGAADYYATGADFGQPSGRFPGGYVVEYGVSATQGGPGAASRCENSDATWYPNLSATGADRERINRVRITLPQVGVGQAIYFTIAQQSRPNVNGTIVDDYMSVKASNIKGSDNVQGNPVLSSYDVVTNNGVGMGKRFKLTTAIARISKDASLTVPGGPTINQATAGGTVWYNLQPALSSVADTPQPTYITIVDFLPEPLEYVDGTAQLLTNTGPIPAGPLEPDSILKGPTGTTLSWTINNVTPNQVLPKLSFKALFPGTIPPDSTKINNVEIATPDDSSDAPLRRADKALNVLNPPGVRVVKSVAAPLIDPNGTPTWKVQVSNFDENPTVIDVIDVLPFIGDGAINGAALPVAIAGRNPPTAYNSSGTTGLAGPVVPSIAGGEIRYSKASTAALTQGAQAKQDPLSTNNTATVADGWCLAAEFGAANPGCPANFAQVTAFRVKGVTVQPNVTLNVDFKSFTLNNQPNDVYTNRFFAAGTGLPTLQSNDVKVTVKVGSISGQVYIDKDRTATKNGADAPIPGTTVTLCLAAPVNGACPPGQIANDAFGVPVPAQTTGPNGTYTFSNLASSPPGGYYVIETPPAGYGTGPTNAAGNLGGNATPNTFAAIKLPVGANGTNYNFGHVATDLNTTVVVPAAPVVPGSTVVATVKFGNSTATDGKNTTATITLTPGTTATITPPSGWTLVGYNQATGVATLVPSDPAGTFPGNSEVVATVAFTAPQSGTVTIVSKITNTIVDLTPNDFNNPASTDPNRNAHQGSVGVIPMSIDVRKRAGKPFETNSAQCQTLTGQTAGVCDAGSTFVIPYRLVVANRSAITATFVQTADYLPATFGADVAPTTIKVFQDALPTLLTTQTPGARVYSAASGGEPSYSLCAPAAPAFDGNANTNLLSGTFDLPPAQQCLIEFTVVVTYPVSVLVPQQSQKNTAFAYAASAPTTAPIVFTPVVVGTPGGGIPTPPVGVRASDVSADSPAIAPIADGEYPSAPDGGFPRPPTRPNSDTPDPTTVSLKGQAIDVTKSVGIPKQLDVAGTKFLIGYSVNISNATLATATNVQLSENLRFTYPAPATFTGGTVTLIAGTCNGTAPALNATFNGARAGTNGPADYNLLGASGISSCNLAPRGTTGDKLALSFQVLVEYPRGQAPVAAALNRIFGSTSNDPAGNSGPPFTAAGLKDGDSPFMITKDTSADQTPTGVLTPGAPPGDPGIPVGGPKSDVGAGTPAKIATLETAKAVTGPVVVTGPGKYKVSYRIAVKAVGVAGTVLPNVQAIDSLVQTFRRAGAATPTLAVSGYSTPAAIGGATTCPASFTTFNGDSNQKLFVGNTPLTVGQGCEFKFDVEVDYGGTSIDTGPHQNTVYSSSVPAPVGGINDGGVVTTVPSATSGTLPAGGLAAGTWTPPAGASAIDASTDGLPLPTTSGADVPLPTPVAFQPAAELESIKYVENLSVPTGAPVRGNDIQWTIVYKNKGTTPLTSVMINDTMNANLTASVVTSALLTPAAVGGDPQPIPNAAYNGVGITAALASPVLLQPGQILTVKIKATVTPTASGTLTNQASLTATEYGGPAGTKVPTSAVNANAPACPNANACVPSGVTVPAGALVSHPSGSGGGPKGLPNQLALAAGGSISGIAWLDATKNGAIDGGEPRIPGLKVIVYAIDPVTGTRLKEVTNPSSRPVTDANGAYTVGNLPPSGPGLEYEVVFQNEAGDAVLGTPTPQATGANAGNNGTVPPTKDKITRIKVTAGQDTPSQNLPLDPSGVVYDSITRVPVPGAVVTFTGPLGFNPAIHLVGGAGNVSQTTGPSGFYQFLLLPGAPAGNYSIVVTPPGTYVPSTLIPPQPGAYLSAGPAGGVNPVVPNALAPQIAAGNPTTYFLTFQLIPGTSADVIHNHIPLDPPNQQKLSISKSVNRPVAELGDTVLYTVKVRNNGLAATPVGATITDRLPAGFRYILGTTMVTNPGASAPVAAPNPAGGVGATLVYTTAVTLPVNGEIIYTYRVRLGVGSMQGDGINRVQARFGAVVSNEAQAKVTVTPGVFTNDACVAGKVFVDCNNNHIQDAEELGVPGVRLYMEDGTYFITDSEGKYSYCGISPKSHVIGVDMLTMPRGSRMTTTTNRNLGDGNSIFLDTKNGQLLRADFAEGSCSNTVLEQVKRRRTQGEVRSTETEKTGQPALKFEGKSPQYPQQGTDSANQPLVVPRPPNGGTPSAPEQNTPVPKMPGASSNTQGANVRNAP
jgi:uncharacterized repeat protein (TIGR01451 family)/fimbrial isopeptide formation D2 family protein